MPHQVVKCAVTGSVGDLAKITRALEDKHINILAVGGAEVGHQGIIALLLEPDKNNMPDILDTVSNVVLDAQTGRRPENVEALPDVHILLNDTPGQLRRAAEALGDVNIETVISVDKQPGFRQEDYDTAVARLEAAHIQIHNHPH
jgi:hypothetical protein